MVALLFEVAGQGYGLDVAQVLRVVPYVHLRQIPSVPAYIAGVFRYRGAMVPVVDLNLLMGQRPVAALLSTRIILVNYQAPSGPGRVLGLLAERATDTIEDDATGLIPSGVSTPEAPYLGKISTNGGNTIQYVRVEELLPVELRDRLFTDEVEA